MMKGRFAIYLMLACLPLGSLGCSGTDQSTASLGGSGGASLGGSGGASLGGSGGASLGGSGGAGLGGSGGAVPSLTDFVGSASDAACVQAKHFLLGLTASSKNGAYPAPALAVTCSATQVTVTSNNIPSFEFVQKTPNALLAMNMSYSFPRFPTQASSTTLVPLGGTVAVAVDGLAIFGPTEAGAMGYRDPYLDGLLDYCNGHTAPNGMYHFHTRPDCLFTDLVGNVRLVVGFAFDGFPILAPYVCSAAGDCTKSEAVSSSWQRVLSHWSGDTPDYTGTTRGSWDIYEFVAGSGDLDECNGRALPGGGYAYYATDTFPYFIGCYRGTASK